ncbi:hypothetical protein HOK51_01240 [Candidatus Woesearchaeota archaeon]|jgi:putative membrane protein|nr:hypothetical protein [Candidatus Woesearchaeota archaeon]MBT6518438.1 hypothetical protein [Candidatus Woesearchaeota archaeon]MBT7366605.1 hypothetical protein [Candidatus Woesearchaeota archaeon]
MIFNLFFELTLAIIIGIFAGIITGLIPGIHVNLISILLISISPFLLTLTSPLALAVFIIALATTHTFLDSIPSVFLGAPDSDHALSVLPGHKLLLEGKGFEAVKLTVIGSFLCLIAAICLVPILIPTVGFIYPYLKNYIGFILLAIIVFMIVKDKKPKLILKNLFIFMLSGILGILILTSPIKDPLFPMLSGLFGTSTLIISLFENNKLPKQTTTETITIKTSTTIKAISAGTFAGTLTSFFPGLGPAQGAVIASQITRNIGDHGFMILVGGINTVNFVLSLITFLVLSKARNGAVIAISNFFEIINIPILLIFISSALIVGSIASIFALKISKIFSRVISKINYQKLVTGVIILVVLLVLTLNGFMGLYILIISTAIGILPPKLNIPRNHAMGCLLLPVVLFFLL